MVLIEEKKRRAFGRGADWKRFLREEMDFHGHACLEQFAKKLNQDIAAPESTKGLSDAVADGHPLLAVGCCKIYDRKDQG